MTDRAGFGTGFGGGGGGGGGAPRGELGAPAGEGGAGRGMRGPPRRPNGPPRRNQQEETKVWVPCTNLGRLVKAGLITSIEEIFLHSIPIKEYQIVEQFFRRPPTSVAGVVPALAEEEKKGLPILQDEVMSISPVQKQTASGQRSRFKAFVIVGDSNGHIGLGSKCAKEVATAIRGAVIDAKLSVVPVRRGYWGSNIGLPHTVPMKVSGKCGSVSVRLIPAPRGSRIVGSPITKKLLTFAGVADCFTASNGHTRTSGNAMKSVYQALARTYSYYTPDLWPNQKCIATPYEDHAQFLDRAEGEEKKVEAAA